MIPSEKQKLSRRTTLKTAGWSAPVVLTSAAVPAYAASTPPTGAELSADYGLFAQMINSSIDNPFDTYAGVHSYEGNVTDSSGNAQYDNGQITGTSGLAAHGEGVFTPGGTVGEGSYGGMGFWASAPYDAATRQAAAGTTLLAAGTSFEVTYRFTFNDEFAINDPLRWRTGADGPYLAIEDNPTSRLRYSNGAAFRARMFAPEIDGLVWTGRLITVLTEDLIISHRDNQSNLGQILASNHAVYHDITEYLEQGEVTIAPIDNAQLVLTATGYDSKIISLVGKQVTTALPF
ncbi:hypothetical protein A7979_03855 [Rothia nasimurium]|uniref:Tat pathway signal sequence domain protein n=1 Tax=Rothia nasimurium TaxID=85336 RepID=A0A1Y1RNN1_9MICC|nr:hypothetical protein [Rothia nasimurium]ORC16465.1 hypothetical protein A7979_03855 [Rothia nasimurium]